MYMLAQVSRLVFQDVRVKGLPLALEIRISDYTIKTGHKLLIMMTPVHTVLKYYITLKNLAKHIHLLKGAMLTPRVVELLL